MRTLSHHILLAALILTFSAAGCQQLQVGYYLTPQNIPTLSATSTQPPGGGDSAADGPPPSPTAPAAPVTPTLQPSPSPTRTPIPCDETRGSILQESFSSRLTGKAFRYRIYLPPCYAATARRYPVLIMLHGLGEGMDDSQWDQLGLDEAADEGFAQGVLAPLIIVMPNGNDADHAGFNGPSPFPEVVVQELIPHVQARFCTWNDPDLWAIGGLSRGGFWAYWIAFQHPELFGRVGGHSPYFYKPDFPTDKNPANLVDTAEGLDRLSMYFDHGPQDYDEVIAGVQDFVTRLERRGIHPEVVINLVGGHTEDYWARHVGDYLSFYAADWPREVEDFPSCHEPSPTGGSRQASQSP